MDATGLLAQLARGESTSEALLDQLLATLDEQNPRLNAVVATDRDGARNRAAEADAARARGDSWGPLHGLPMTIKDCYDVAGMPNTSGSGRYADHRPTTHADAVQRLVDAGAIVFGKTNLPPFAGEWQSFNDLHGVTNNPYDPTRTPGGSSGGSAASVASGMSPLELGSDIGGSIRIPAHFCGVFGHKPTHGLIPLRGHVPGPPGTQSEPDLAVAGPLARSARDLALALDVLVGPRHEDRAWSIQLPEPRTTSVGDLRAGVWLDDPACPLEDDVRGVLTHGVERMADAGLTVQHGAPDGMALSDVAHIYLHLLAPIMATGLPEHVFNRLLTMRPLLRLMGRVRPPPSALSALFLDGATQRHRDWLRTHEARAKLQARMRRWFEQVDVLLMPVAPWTAFPHAHAGAIQTRRITAPSGSRAYVDHLYWASLATTCGLPSTTVPVGLTPEGLPVGIQVVGPRYGDRLCIAVAAVMERVLGGFVPPGT